MDDISIFPDKAIQPTEKVLAEKLESTYALWVEINDFVINKYPDGLSEWNFPGKKYGWSFRIKDKKRAIIYLMPRSKYFKVVFVFGQKATDDVINSDISMDIKNELEQAKKYAEGRGISITVKNESKIDDIKKLALIKLSN